MVENKSNNILNNNSTLSLINKNIKTLLKVPLNVHLTSLNLHFNQIHKIECLHMCPKLTYLNLSSNNITIIEGLSSLTSLETLNLSCNLINTVQNLEKLSNLKSLDLSYNNFKEIDGLNVFNNSKLSSLYLEGNKISNLHNTISILKPITTLKKLVFDDANTRHYSNVPSTAAIDIFNNDKNIFNIHLQNPICQLQEYRTTVLECLPNLTSLDHISNKRDPCCLPPRLNENCDDVCYDDYAVSGVSSECSELERLMKVDDSDEPATPVKVISQQYKHSIEPIKRPSFEENIYISKIPRPKKRNIPLIIPPLENNIMRKDNLLLKNKPSSRGDGFEFAGYNNNNAASIDTPTKDDVDSNNNEKDGCRDVPSTNRSTTNINDNNKNSMSIEKDDGGLEVVLEDCTKQKNKKWKKKNDKGSTKKVPNDIKLKGIIQLEPITSQKGYKKPKKPDGYSDTFGINTDFEKGKKVRENDSKTVNGSSERNSGVGFYDGEELTKMLLEEKERNKELQDQLDELEEGCVDNEMSPCFDELYKKLLNTRKKLRNVMEENKCLGMENIHLQQKIVLLKKKDQGPEEPEEQGSKLSQEDAYVQTEEDFQKIICEKEGQNLELQEKLVEAEKETASLKLSLKDSENKLMMVNEDKEKLQKSLETLEQTEKTPQDLTQENPLVKILSNELDYLKKELSDQKIASNKELAQQKQSYEEEKAKYIEASKYENEELVKQIEDRLMLEKISPLQRELEEVKEKYKSLENEFVEALMTENSRFKKLKCAFDMSDCNYKRCKKEQESLKATLGENLTLLADLNEIVKKRKEQMKETDRKREEHVKSLNEEIERLKKEVKSREPQEEKMNDLKENFEALKTKHESLKEEKKSVDMQLQKLVKSSKENLQQKDETILSLKGRLSEVEEALQKSNSDNEVKKKLLENQGENLLANSTSLKESRAEILNLEKKVASLNGDVENLTSALETSAKQGSALKSTLEEVSNALEGKMKENKELRTSLQHNKKEIEVIEKRIEKAAEDKKLFSQRLEETKSQMLEKGKEMLEKTKSEYQKKFASELTDREIKLKLAEKKLSEVEEEMRHLLREWEKERDRHADTVRQLSSLIQRMKN